MTATLSTWPINPASLRPSRTKPVQFEDGSKVFIPCTPEKRASYFPTLSTSLIFIEVPFWSYTSPTMAPKRNNKNGNRRKRRTPRTQVVPNSTLTYAEMVADPCNAQLVPGIFGRAEGLLARVHNTDFNPGLATQTAGYVLWCPDYTGGDEPNSDAANLFTWGTTHPDIVPENTVANRFGDSDFLPYAGESITTSGFPDPAARLVASDLIQDSRCIGACMKLTYTGKLLDSGGQFARISDLPLTSLLHGGAIDETYPDGRPASVTDLFRYATNIGRIDALPLEIVHRPDDSSHIFRSEDQSPTIRPAIGPTAYTDEALAQQPQFFGFVWRGLPDGLNPMVFDFYKSLEWRAEPNSGIAGVRTRSLHATNQVPLATHLLDQVAPGWTNRAPGTMAKLHRLTNDPRARRAGKFMFNMASQYAQQRLLGAPNNQLSIGYVENVGAPAVQGG